MDLDEFVMYSILFATVFFGLYYLSPRFEPSRSAPRALQPIGTFLFGFGWLATILGLVFIGVKAQWWMPLVIAPTAYVCSLLLLSVWLRIEVRSPSFTRLAAVGSMFLVPFQLVLIFGLLVLSAHR